MMPAHHRHRCDCAAATPAVASAEAVAAAAAVAVGIDPHRRLLLRALAGAGALGAAAALGGCAGTVTTTPGGIPIDTRHNSKGQDSRVLFLILHYTVADLPLSIHVLTQKDVSAHYLLTDEERPRILRLVPEERRAWHSGPSAWKGHRLLNASSIGIEIVHPGFRLGPDGQRIYLPFPERQMQTLIPLVRDIVARHQIRPERILGHGEVSPQFKQDPGPTFPWRRLSELGITPPWPDAARVAALQAVYERERPDIVWFQERLAQHGYAIEQTGALDEQMLNVMMNFQMRYRPHRYDGMPDAETAALLAVLTAPAEAR